MKKNEKTTGFRTAKFCIQTIRYQDLIACHVRAYTIYATGIILLLWFAGKIAITAALLGLGIGGLSICILLALLIQARKKALLAIADPKLRREAQEAMLFYLSRRRLSQKEKRIIFGHGRAFHSPHSR
ncbi:MAG: hypothetical protein R2941_20865 [Desulfobacterales bacterium]